MELSEKINSKLDSFIDKISCLKQILQATNLRDNREKYSKLRNIYINNIKPDDYNLEQDESLKPLVYSDNKVVTSKVIYFIYLFIIISYLL